MFMALEDEKKGVAGYTWPFECQQDKKLMVTEGPDAYIYSRYMKSGRTAETVFFKIK